MKRDEATVYSPDDYRLEKQIQPGTEEGIILARLQGSHEFCKKLEVVLSSALHKGIGLPKERLKQNYQSHCRTLFWIILDARKHAALNHSRRELQIETQKSFSDLSSAVALLIKHFSQPMILSSDGSEWVERLNAHNENVIASRRQLVWMSEMINGAGPLLVAGYASVFPASQKKKGERAEALAFAIMLTRDVESLLGQPFYSFIEITTAALFSETEETILSGEQIRSAWKDEKKRSQPMVTGRKPIPPVDFIPN